MSTRDTYILLTFVIQREDGQFAAHCRELGTSSCGDTLEEARAALEDAVRLHLETLDELGERSRFFRERGIKIRRAAEPVDVLPAQDVVEFGKSLPSCAELNRPR